MKAKAEEWIFEVIVFAIVFWLGEVCGWVLKVGVG